MNELYARRKKLPGDFLRELQHADDLDSLLLRYTSAILFVYYASKKAPVLFLILALFHIKERN